MDPNEHLRCPVWIRKAESFGEGVDMDKLVTLLAEEYRAGQEIEIAMRQHKRGVRGELLDAR